MSHCSDYLPYHFVWKVFIQNIIIHLLQCNNFIFNLISHFEYVIICNTFQQVLDFSIINLVTKHWFVIYKFSNKHSFLSYKSRLKYPTVSKRCLLLYIPATKKEFEN